VKCDFHQARINTQRADSADLIPAMTGAQINPATKASRLRRCRESVIKPNRLEIS
jgi:hypothetical protein